MKTPVPMQDAQEMQPLREVPRVPTCCGQPMKKLGAPGVLGNVRTAYTCRKECGNTYMEPEPAKT